MQPEFIHVRCPHCQQSFQTSAGAVRERISLLMPVLKLLSTRCPHCGAKMHIGDTRIVAPPPLTRHAI